MSGKLRERLMVGSNIPDKIDDREYTVFSIVRRHSFWVAFCFLSSWSYVYAVQPGDTFRDCENCPWTRREPDARIFILKRLLWAFKRIARFGSSEAKP